ncbi:VOC family protein [Pseudonocardia kujensis]|uniref:VOC family protein n=1 Tax=Pseudonocardia kujensis TaxID=1128675 RepID=UPI001E291F5A|nr:VOC family protein [Pseudonocardia kujensis]MCE0763538.1 VOC family protein [Pseudonocardia kujensis]
MPDFTETTPRLAHRLGYVVLQVDDLQVATDMFVHEVQLQVNEKTDEAVYLGSGNDHHWVVLRSDEGVPRGLRTIGFELDGSVSFEQAEAVLDEAGIPHERSTDPVAKDRVGELLRLADPDGTTIELFRGMLSAPWPNAPRWVQLERILHTAIAVGDFKKSLHFYTAVLGLRESDWIEETSVFLHATDRYHHSLVLQQRPGPPRVDHLCFQTETFDDVMRARAIIQRSGFELRDDLLKHAPSGSIGFYFHGLPEGLGIEFCHGHAIVEPDHKPGRFARVLQAKDVWQPPADY